MEIDKVYNENCLDTMARMKDGFIDLTVTSPPYDNLRTYNGYSFDFEKVAKELYRVTKNGGVVVWVVGDETVNGSETGTSFRQALFFMECGFNLHDTMIWCKDTTAFPDSNRYFQATEYMFILSKGVPGKFNRIEDRKNKYAGAIIHGTSRGKNGETKRKTNSGIVREYGSRFNYWIQPTEKQSKDYGHPAMFPEKLANDHIISWSNEHDLVYDPFMGSGTTGKCAKDLVRHYIGSEISEEYTAIANKRIASIAESLFM